MLYLRSAYVMSTIRAVVTEIVYRIPAVYY